MTKIYVFFIPGSEVGPWFGGKKSLEVSEFSGGEDEENSGAWCC